MRVDHLAVTGVAPDVVWTALRRGAWAGAVSFEDGGAEWAGAVRLLDVDEDGRRAHCHAQVRRARGFGGVSAALELRPDDAGAVAVAGDARLAGAASEDVARSLAEEVGFRLTTAARDLEPSPADDPAFRRRLAGRAALAVAVGVAAGLAGAAWGRRRQA